MEISAAQRRKWIDANREEYADHPDLRWVTPEGAAAAQAERDLLLADLADDIILACDGTKPHLGPLSPGCRACAAGSWSCLFINGRCNCRCFYCPTEQNETGEPTTNRIAFSDPREYIDYLRRFGFQGISISGGEPLLTFQRSLDFIRAVREELGEEIYLWLYTNGVLLKHEHIDELEAAGLNEIRFDLSAVDYDPAKIALAAGRIPCVTVEIPAIPEDRRRLEELLPTLVHMGVDHLHLHQLRLTPFNSSRLIDRDYTFVHGPKVTVLESELTALAVMHYTRDQGIALPINYCTFTYKSQYQSAATRRRSASVVIKSHESLTESGFIRTLGLAGNSQAIAKVAERLRARSDVDPALWSLSGSKERLWFHPQLRPCIDHDAGRLCLGYSEALLTPQISYRCAFKEVRLSGGRKIYVEREIRCPETILDEYQSRVFHALLDISSPPKAAGQSFFWIEFEFIRPGLQPYF